MFRQCNFNSVNERGNRFDGRRLKRPRGFTLLEIFIASSIFLLVVLVLARFMFLGKRGYEESFDSSVLQGASRKAILTMLSELQESREIEIPDVQPMEFLTRNLAVVRNGKYEQIEYAFKEEAGSIVRRNLSTDDPDKKKGKVIVENVKALFFTRLSDKLLSVRVVVTTDDKDDEKRRESQIITSFFLRNKL